MPTAIEVKVVLRMVPANIAPHREQLYLLQGKPKNSQRFEICAPHSEHFINRAAMERSLP